MCFNSAVFNRQTLLKKKIQLPFVFLSSHIDIKNYGNDFPITNIASENKTDISAG